MAQIYDLIILGAGPAGITAAVYAVRKRLDFLVVSLDIGGQTAWSGDIENYTGYQFISGPELTAKFQEHMESFGTKVNLPEKVKAIETKEKLIKITTDKAEYMAKTVIIATGKSSRLLGVSGEAEFKNKGVTYCATCDGPVFSGKNVAIIGGGNSALEAALQMIKISPRVEIVNIAAELTGDPIMIEKLNKSDVVKIHNKAEVIKIYGDTFVKGIEVKQKDKVYNLEVAGVFVEIGLVPNSGFAEILTLNAKKEIVVDSFNRTSLAGVFAAGDVTNIPEKQIVIACGEGAKACLSVFKYLSRH